MNSTPDLVPTLAAVALFAEGMTRLRNIAHVRHKESNRVEELARELSRLGADVRTTADSLEIHPAPLHGSLLDSHEDHRLAMSFALVGLRVPGVLIDNPECVRKSFPKFWDEFDLMTSATLRTTTGTSTA
jgi:3-phosphoshikimate 1-carboxyvinyltransferase